MTEMTPNQINAYRRKFMALVTGTGTITAAFAPHLILHVVQANRCVAAEQAAASTSLSNPSSPSKSSKPSGNVMKVRPLDQPVSSQVRWGILIDIHKLQDGGATMLAVCQKEHGWGNDPHANVQQQAHWIRTVQVTDKQTKHRFTLPIMCQHCEFAPCVDVCPTGASMRRADGIVQVNKHICIGCRYCMMACPYKARSFVHEPLTDQRPYSPRGIGTVESCNMCARRIDHGQLPACVEAEPDAVIFGDLNDPNSRISQVLKEQGAQQIRADLDLNTGVRYQGL